MEKKKINSKQSTSFFDVMIDDLVYSKSCSHKVLKTINPFYSYFETKLKEKLKKIKDQRCLGYIKANVGSYDKKEAFLQKHREQGNLKVRLIKNYNFNDELIIINTAGGLTSGDVNIHKIKVDNKTNKSYES